MELQGVSLRKREKERKWGMGDEEVRGEERRGGEGTVRGVEVKRDEGKREEDEEGKKEERRKIDGWKREEKEEIA